MNNSIREQQRAKLKSHIENFEKTTETNRMRILLEEVITCIEGPFKEYFQSDGICGLTLQNLWVTSVQETMYTVLVNMYSKKRSSYKDFEQFVKETLGSERPELTGLILYQYEILKQAKEKQTT